MGLYQRAVAHIWAFRTPLALLRDAVLSVHWNVNEDVEVRKEAAKTLYQQAATRSRTNRRYFWSPLSAPLRLRGIVNRRLLDKSIV